MLSKELLKTIEKLPADDYQTAQGVCEKLMAGGAETIEQLVELVGDRFGDPQGVKPKYAVHGLVHHACRPGNEARRKLLAETLAGQLAAHHSDELKAFIVRQLQLCGRADQVPALATLLDNDRLCNPATQALVAIGGTASLRALRDAQPKAEGPRKVAVDQAVEILSQP